MWKCCKLHQLGCCFSVAVEALGSHFRWCRDDSRRLNFFGLMMYHLSTKALQFIVCLCSCHCKCKVTSSGSDNQLMSCNLLRVVIKLLIQLMADCLPCIPISYWWKGDCLGWIQSSDKTYIERGWAKVAWHD